MSFDSCTIDEKIIQFADMYGIFIKNMEEESNFLIVKQLVEQHSQRMLHDVYQVDYNEETKDVFNSIMRRHWEILELERL